MLNKHKNRGLITDILTVSATSTGSKVIGPISACVFVRITYVLSALAHAFITYSRHGYCQYMNYIHSYKYMVWHNTIIFFANTPTHIIQNRLTDTKDLSVGRLFANCNLHLSHCHDHSTRSRSSAVC